jgi:hypothetical protein
MAGMAIYIQPRLLSAAFKGIFLTSGSFREMPAKRHHMINIYTDYVF